MAIGGSLKTADGYCVSTNTIYEFYGDYWHGNLNVYDPNDTNKHNNKTYQFLYDKTMEREKLIRDLGYNLITVWESDFRKARPALLAAIQAKRKRIDDGLLQFYNYVEQLMKNQQ